jgi:hypothetical protein
MEASRIGVAKNTSTYEMFRSAPLVRGLFHTREYSRQHSKNGDYAACNVEPATPPTTDEARLESGISGPDGL